jgi:hypothetical protein
MKINQPETERFLSAIVRTTTKYPYDIALFSVLEHFIAAVKATNLSEDTVVVYVSKAIKNESSTVPSKGWPVEGAGTEEELLRLHDELNKLFQKQRPPLDVAVNALLTAVVMMSQVSGEDRRMFVLKEIRRLWGQTVAGDTEMQTLNRRGGLNG